MITIDIVADINSQDDEVLSILSRAPSDTSLTTRAVTYPTRVEHVDEAQSLIAKVSSSGPQSWLTTFTQCVLVNHSRNTAPSAHINS